MQPISSKTAIRPRLRALHDYNNKLIEFANANINTTFDFVQKLSGVNSPSAFVVLSTEYARKQFETLTEQTKQLTELAQKVTLATRSHSRQVSQKRSTRPPKLSCR